MNGFVTIKRVKDYSLWYNLISLPNYEMFIKLMIDGTQSKAFSARTVEPVEKCLN